jgi:hypothetical protein
MFTALNKSFVVILKHADLVLVLGIVGVLVAALEVAPGATLDTTPQRFVQPPIPQMSGLG